MSSIDVIFQAAVHMRGLSKKDRSPFDFSEVRYMTPIENVSRENFQLSGYGAEQQALSLASPELIHKFADVRPGQWVSLHLGPNPRNLQRNLCTGVDVIESKK